MPVISESSLHGDLKRWYSLPGDLTEHPVDGYIIDIVRGKTLVEIQTGNFAKIKPKLNHLLSTHHVHLVHPIPAQKWIVRHASLEEEAYSRRKSPKKGRLEHLFNELVFIPDFLVISNFTLEVLFTSEEEIRVNDGKGSWRRRGWSIVNRNLLKVNDSISIGSTDELLSHFREDLNGQITTKELASRRNISSNLARKIIYCFRKMDILKAIGKKGRASVYTLNQRRMYQNQNTT